MIVIRGVIIDSFVGIAAGSVDRNFIGALIQFTASSLLVDRGQDMLELADTLALRFSGF